MTYRLFFTVVTLLFIALFQWLIVQTTSVRFPSAEQPIELYANHAGDDLTLTLTRAVQNAQESVLLIIYSLNDSSIIESLRSKAETGVPVTVIYDAKASPYAKKRLGSKVSAHKRSLTGLMHQKILVIDQRHNWIGSANMTGDSLHLHGNLVSGIYSQELAHLIWKRAHTILQNNQKSDLVHQTFDIGSQEMEFWFLPDNSNGSEKIIQLIRSAQKTIKIAMFTWTRFDFAQETIQASLRGVKVEVVLDKRASLGASAQIKELFSKNQIPLRISQGNALLHYKFLYLDNHTLVHGSANWTLAAFTKNEDCFMILKNLTVKQQEQLNQLWKIIVKDSTPIN